MATALRKGLRVQSGIESVWSTIVPATAIHAANSSILYKPDDTVEERDELNGLLTASTDGPDILGTAGSVRETGWLTYQEILRALESGYHTATPSGDGGAPVAYTRLHAPGVSAEKTAVSRSLEAGGLTEAFVFPGSVVANYQWSCALKSHTLWTVNWISKDMIAQAFTAALTRRTVTRVLGQLWQVFSDTTWAGLGGTALTSCLTNIAFDSGPLQEYSNCINGLPTPASVIQHTAGQPKVTLTFKLSAETLALFTAYRAGAMKFLRLRNLGAVAIHTTVFPKLQFDLATAILEYPEVGDAVTEQSLTAQLVYHGRADTTSGKSLEVTTVTALATVP